MGVQAAQGREAMLAQNAHVRATAVAVRPFGRDVSRDRLGTSDQLPRGSSRDEAIAVMRAEELVDHRAVDAGRARAGFEMLRDRRAVGKHVAAAERTWLTTPDVPRRAHVLFATIFQSPSQHMYHLAHLTRHLYSPLHSWLANEMPACGCGTRGGLAAHVGHALPPPQRSSCNPGRASGVPTDASPCPRRMG